MNIKKLLTVSLLSLAVVPAFAQFLLSQPNKKDWFVNAQLGPNFAIADNINDHSVFRYFSDGVGFGFDVNVGKFFSKSVGFRLGTGYSNVKNRADNETVTKSLDFLANFKGNGFYHFSLFEVYGDVLFDLTSMSSYYKADDRRFHVLGSVGFGLLSTGEKKFYPTENISQADPEMIEKLLGGLVKKDKETVLACRLGFILDYRFSPHVSGNFEINANMINDKFDGIDFDEPIDFLFRTSLGVTYYF